MFKKLLCLVFAVAWVTVAGGAPMPPDSAGINGNLCLWLLMTDKYCC